MPKKMRRAALRCALSVKAAADQILVLEGLTSVEPKAKTMSQVLSRLAGEQSKLILLPRKDENYERIALAVNNLVSTKSLLAAYINIRDLLTYDKIIMPLESVDVITSHLG
jgi:large subunit ribosomal protein L4